MSRCSVASSLQAQHVVVVSCGIEKLREIMLNAAWRTDMTEDPAMPAIVEFPQVVKPNLGPIFDVALPYLL